MFTRDSKILSNRITTPITDVSNVVGDVFKITLSQTIGKLFANNEQGFAYDPNDLSTMFQDAAGTMPVTAAGQAVGLILDKSGRGNHARQTASASRPILRQDATTGAYYLEFDGSDDFLVTNSIDFTSTNKVSLVVGVHKPNTSGSAIVTELSASSSVNNGSFHLAAPNSLNGNNYEFASRGIVRSLAISPANYIPPVSNVVSVFGWVSTATAILRVNGSQVASSAEDQGTGNYGNHPLYIGRRGGTSLTFNGHIYGLIGIGRLTTDAETIALEKLIAKNTGVTLSV